MLILFLVYFYFLFSFFSFKEIRLFLDYLIELYQWFSRTDQLVGQLLLLLYLWSFAICWNQSIKNILIRLRFSIVAGDEFIYVLRKCFRDYLGLCLITFSLLLVVFVFLWYRIYFINRCHCSCYYLTVLLLLVRGV